jgi:hypothetical protein
MLCKRRDHVISSWQRSNKTRNNPDRMQYYPTCKYLPMAISVECQTFKRSRLFVAVNSMLANQDDNYYQLHYYYYMSLFFIIMHLRLRFKYRIMTIVNILCTRYYRSFVVVVFYLIVNVQFLQTQLTNNLILPR